MAPENKSAVQENAPQPADFSVLASAAVSADAGILDDRAEQLQPRRRTSSSASAC